MFGAMDYPYILSYQCLIMAYGPTEQVLQN